MTVRLDTENLNPKSLGGETFLAWPDSEEENGYREDAKQVRTRFNRAVEEAESLLSDERFSEEGHRQRLAEPEGDLAKQKGWLTEKRKRIEKKLRQVEEERSRLSPFDPADHSDARAAVREREIRSKLEEMEPVERRELLTEAAESGQDEVVRAALDAPGGFSPVGEATAQLVERRAMEARHSEEVEELDERERHLQRLHREVKAATEILNSPDRLMDVAAPDEEA